MRFEIRPFFYEPFPFSVTVNAPTLPFIVNARSWGFGTPNPQDKLILPFIVNGRTSPILGVRNPEPPG